MSNTEIKDRAKEICRESFKPLIILYLADVLFDIISEKTEFLPLVILLGIASVVITVGSYYMLMRGWIEGRMDINHLLIPFKSSVYSGKILPIILMETLVVGAAAIPTVVMIVMMSLNPAGFYVPIMLIFLIGFLVVAVAVSLTWYIFIMEPELSVTAMMRRSAGYMSRHWWGEFKFRFSITFIPALIAGTMMQFIDESLVQLLLIPVEIYIGVAGVGYIYERILMVERGPQPAYIRPVAAAEPVTEPAPEIPQETIEQLTERLTEEAGKDIELELPAIETAEENSDEL
ncbi:MAG: hypothetical protein IJ362_01690 [Oscillospiraceae bacterium]|nr:hypothetical protein [Oscillospiraceae bacterium]